jgi:hypothetical protein
MYQINRVKHPELSRTWNLEIFGSVVGSVEIVHMTDTLRSINGDFLAFTKGTFEPIKVSYRCEETNYRKTYSISKFIEDIIEAIGDREIHLSTHLPEDAHDQIIVPSDVTEENAADIAKILKVDVASRQEVLDYLRLERSANMEMPMLNLIRLSRMAKTRPTPLHIHEAL